jgi:hypothetical protein
MNKLLLVLLFTSTLAQAEDYRDANRSTMDSFLELQRGLAQDREKRFNQTMEDFKRFNDKNIYPQSSRQQEIINIYPEPGYQIIERVR